MLRVRVAQPSDVEVGLVAGHELVVIECFEALGLGVFGAGFARQVAVDEAMQVLTGEFVFPQGEVLTGPEVVDPEFRSPDFSSRARCLHGAEDSHSGLADLER